MYTFQLPIKIDIIKHAREIDGKSTAAHAAVLAPDDVTIYTYPDIPDYGEDEKVKMVVVFVMLIFVYKYFANYPLCF